MTRSRPGFLALVAAFVVSAPVSGIQLDPTFGGRGIAEGPGGIGVVGMALQSDGAIVTVGNSEGSSGIALLRFTRAGTLDPTFGSGGIATSFTSSNIFPSAIAVQLDGRIVIVGSIRPSTTPSFFVARYLSDGSLDPSFGSGGSITTSLTPEGDSASALVLQPDGRIVVAGSGGPAFEGAAQNFEVVRYDPDGSLDSSFGTGGSVIANMGGPGTSIVLRPDGRLVVGGWTQPPSGQGSFALLGLLATGAADPGFGVSGQVFTQVETYDFNGTIALSRDGRIVLAGAAQSPTVQQWLVVLRYDADGSLDPTFASGGIFRTDLGPPVAVAVDSQNRVVVTGDFSSGFGLLRILANGGEDLSVGPQGWTSVLGGTPPQLQAYPAALVLQSDGGILIGGTDVEIIIGIPTVVRFVGSATAVPALSLSSAVVLAIVLGLAGYLAIQRAA